MSLQWFKLSEIIGKRFLTRKKILKMIKNLVQNTVLQGVEKLCNVKPD